MVEVEFTIYKDALDFIMEKALEYKLGAPGLRSLCEAMYELPSSDDKILEIDVDYAKETLCSNLLKRFFNCFNKFQIQ